MDFLSLIFYLLLTITFLLVLHWLLTARTETRSNLPPGPARLPVVGNLLKLGDMPHKSLAELAKTHGPIMSLKLGRITTVVISSAAVAKEVLQKQDLAFSSNRSIPNAVHAEEQYKYSVIWLPVSDRWRSIRKIMNSCIFSGSRLDANQNFRQQKVKDLIAYVGKCCQGGVAVDIGSAAFTTSLNVLSNTVFSVDLAGLSQESAKEFRNLATGMTREAGKPNLVDYFPVLAKLDPQGIRRRIAVHFRKMIQLIGRLIDERLKLRTSQKTDTENDVLDILLNLSKDIDRTHMERMIMDLFVAGTDTTSSTTEWAMAELLHNPTILMKAKVELEHTIGRGKLIQESDISRLPYLRATVKETMRIYPPAPLLLPRTVEADVEVHGYIVPKAAHVLVNAWAIGRDPSIWMNPTTFMPERFLGSEVDVRGQDFELIPFGAGRRICPGLPLAIRIVPVVLGSLLNSFEWKLEGGIAPEELNMEEKFGITLQRAQPLRAIPFHLSQF